MNISKQFEGYAAAFERVFVDDNWSQLTQYFAINACYITRGATFTKAEGRDALFSTLRYNLSNFDRRFDKRDLITIEGPWVVGNKLTRKWQCCFTLKDVPDLRIQGIETVTYEGDQIVLLEEEIGSESQVEMASWLRQHGSKIS